MRLAPVVIAVCLAGSALAQSGDIPSAIVVRPHYADPALPRGGLFVAGVTSGDESTIDEARFSTVAEGPGEPLALYPSCTLTGTCVWRTRFPFDDPSSEQVFIQMTATLLGAESEGPSLLPAPPRTPIALDASYAVPVGRRDDDAPTGLDTAEVALTDEAPNLSTPDWRYFATARASGLADASGIALLELFDVSEGDRVLVGQTVPFATTPAGEVAVTAPVDLPETDTRCFQLVATDLGGNEAMSEALCSEITLDEGCAHAGGAPGARWPVAVLAVVVVQLARRRRPAAGSVRPPTASS